MPRAQVLEGNREEESPHCWPKELSPPLLGRQVPSPLGLAVTLRSERQLEQLVPSSNSHCSAPNTGAGALPRQSRVLWGQFSAGFCREIKTGLISRCRAAQPQAHKKSLDTSQRCRTTFGLTIPVKGKRAAIPGLHLIKQVFRSLPARVTHTHNEQQGLSSCASPCRAAPFCPLCPFSSQGQREELSRQPPAEWALSTSLAEHR